MKYLNVYFYYYYLNFPFCHESMLYPNLLLYIQFKYISPSLCLHRITACPYQKEVHWFHSWSFCLDVLPCFLQVPLTVKSHTIRLYSDLKWNFCMSGSVNAG